jgi:hypothetical protein
MLRLAGGAEFLREGREEGKRAAACPSCSPRGESSRDQRHATPGIPRAAMPRHLAWRVGRCALARSFHHRSSTSAVTCSEVSTMGKRNERQCLFSITTTEHAPGIGEADAGLAERLRTTKLGDHGLAGFFASLRGRGDGGQSFRQWQIRGLPWLFQRPGTTASSIVLSPGLAPPRFMMPSARLRGTAADPSDRSDPPWRALCRQRGKACRKWLPRLRPCSSSSQCRW